MGKEGSDGPGVADMIQLSELSQEAMLENIRVRYQENRIYTYTGNILVSVNPYQSLNIYTADILSRYSRANDLSLLPPHVFAIAARAYRLMIEEQRDQSILISGESGAGKTEATKLCMHYLSTVTGKHSDIETMLLEVSPVLEAFGNAKTVRNDNSSRFGKYSEVHFGSSGEGIVGARMVQYLLEKSRVVSQQKDERNYHIFYHLIAGAEPRVADRLHLAPAQTFAYLNGGKCTTVPGIDDAESLQDVVAAFSVLGISEQRVDSVWRILAAILHIGQLKFKKGGNGAVPDDNNTVAHAASALGIPPEALADALAARLMSVRGETTRIAHTPAEARDAANALSKALYSNLFDWLVRAMNLKLSPGIANHSKNFIGILDIFGFENFKINSFEQLNINFANEKLQQQFNQVIFENEQKEYIAEGIKWENVEFADGRECVALIESKMGVLSLLDEQCRFPRSTDQTLLEKLHSQLADHPNYIKPRLARDEFGVNHYAGEVSYKIENFLDKNRDTLPEHFPGLISRSSDAFIAHIFDEDDSWETKQAESTPADPGASRGRGRGRGRGGPMRGGRGRGRGRGGGPSPVDSPKLSKGGGKKQTVGGMFKSQLVELMDKLNSTHCSYIRCLKPNPEKSPSLFTDQMVADQLRYSGMLETIRIRKLGYGRRFLFEDFRRRFGIITSVKNDKPMEKATSSRRKHRSKPAPPGSVVSPRKKGKPKPPPPSADVVSPRRKKGKPAPPSASDHRRSSAGGTTPRANADVDDKTACQAIFNSKLMRYADGADSGYLIGKTKVFVRDSFMSELESAYRHAVTDRVVLIQSWWRALGVRQEFLAKRAAVTSISAMWRMYAERKRYQKKIRAIVVLQSFARMIEAKKELRRLQWLQYTAFLVQASARGLAARKAYDAMLKVKRERERLERLAREEAERNRNAHEAQKKKESLELAERQRQEAERQRLAAEAEQARLAREAELRKQEEAAAAKAANAQERAALERAASARRAEAEREAAAAAAAERDRAAAAADAERRASTAAAVVLPPPVAPKVDMAEQRRLQELEAAAAAAVESQIGSAVKAARTEASRRESNVQAAQAAAARERERLEHEERVREQERLRKATEVLNARKGALLEQLEPPLLRRKEVKSDLSLSSKKAAETESLAVAGKSSSTLRKRVGTLVRKATLRKLAESSPNVVRPSSSSGLEGGLATTRKSGTNRGTRKRSATNTMTLNMGGRSSGTLRVKGGTLRVLSQMADDSAIGARGSVSGMETDVDVTDTSDLPIWIALPPGRPRAQGHVAKASDWRSFCSMVIGELQVGTLRKKNKTWVERSTYSTSMSQPLTNSLPADKHETAMMMFEMINVFIAVEKKKRKAQAGAAATPEQIAAAQRVLAVVWDSKELKVELFCQIAKQITFNPSARSALRCWQLLACACASFAPMDDMYDALMEFFGNDAFTTHADANKEEVSFEEITNLCKLLLSNVARKGGRALVLTRSEISAIASIGSAAMGGTVTVSLEEGLLRIPVIVYLDDNEEIPLAFSPDTTAHELLRAAMLAVGFDDHVASNAEEYGYALFERSMRLERSIGNQERIGDVLGKWEAYHKMLSDSSVTFAEMHFILHRKVYMTHQREWPEFAASQKLAMEERRAASNGGTVRKEDVRQSVSADRRLAFAAARRLVMQGMARVGARDAVLLACLSQKHMLLYKNGRDASQFDVRRHVPSTAWHIYPPEEWRTLVAAQGEHLPAVDADKVVDMYMKHIIRLAAGVWAATTFNGCTQPPDNQRWKLPDVFALRVSATGLEFRTDDTTPGQPPLWRLPWTFVDSWVRLDETDLRIVLSSERIKGPPVVVRSAQAVEIESLLDTYYKALLTSPLYGRVRRDTPGTPVDGGAEVSLARGADLAVLASPSKAQNWLCAELLDDGVSLGPQIMVSRGALEALFDDPRTLPDDPIRSQEEPLEPPEAQRKAFELTADERTLWGRCQGNMRAAAKALAAPQEAPNPQRDAAVVQLGQRLYRQPFEPLAACRHSTQLPSDMSLLLMLGDTDVSHIFRLLLDAMGDEPFVTHEPEPVIIDINSRMVDESITTLIQYVLHSEFYEMLVDELYCMLLRQLSYNPRSSSRRRGWLLLRVLAGIAVPATPDVHHAVLQFVRLTPWTEDTPHLLHKFHALTRRVANPAHSRRDGRFYGPSVLEIGAVRNRQLMPVDVFLPDERKVRVFVEPFSTAAETRLAVLEHLDIDPRRLPNEWELFEVDNPKLVGDAAMLAAPDRGFVTRHLEDHRVIADALRRFEEAAAEHTQRAIKSAIKSGALSIEGDQGRDSSEGAAAPPSYLGLRRHIYGSLQERRRVLPVVRGALQLEFQMAAQHVLSGRYAVAHEEAMKLEGLRLQATRGDRTAHSDASIRENGLSSHLPPSSLALLTEETIGKMTAQVLLHWSEHAGRPPQVCQTQYVSKVKHLCKLYGSTFFAVQHQRARGLHRACWLALNFDGMFLVSRDRTEQLPLEWWKYDEFEFKAIKFAFNIAWGSLQKPRRMHIVYGASQEISKYALFYKRGVVPEMLPQMSLHYTGRKEKPAPPSAGVASAGPAVGTMRKKGKPPPPALYTDFTLRGSAKGMDTMSRGGGARAAAAASNRPQATNRALLERMENSGRVSPRGGARRGSGSPLLATSSMSARPKPAPPGAGAALPLPIAGMAGAIPPSIVGQDTTAVDEAAVSAQIESMRQSSKDTKPCDECKKRKATSKLITAKGTPRAMCQHCAKKACEKCGERRATSRVAFGGSKQSLCGICVASRSFMLSPRDAPATPVLSAPPPPMSQYGAAPPLGNLPPPIATPPPGVESKVVDGVNVIAPGMETLKRRKANLCEICSKRPSDVQITGVQGTSRKVCNSCAKKMCEDCGERKATRKIGLTGGLVQKLCNECVPK